VQVVGIPIADDFAPYLEQLANTLRQQGIRVEVDRSDNRMQKKIRDHTLAKVPFILLAGERDVAQNTVSFRYRSGEQENDIPLGKAIEMIAAAIRDKKQV
jgi:threonyl-tRNA synthetase